MEGALAITRERFDVGADGVELIYSNGGLAPWHGGCAIGKRIQLRKEFERQETYFFLRRDELIAHELVHAFRGDQPDSLFEEILAFQTSRSWWRRFFSPVFRSHWETMLFLGSVLGAAALIWFSPWFYLVPGTLALAGLVRLCFRQWQFHRCLRRLRRLVTRPNAVMVRLSAEEIIRLGRGANRDALLRKALALGAVAKP